MCSSDLSVSRSGPAETTLIRAPVLALSSVTQPPGLPVAGRRELATQTRPPAVAIASGAETAFPAILTLPLPRGARADGAAADAAPAPPTDMNIAITRAHMPVKTLAIFLPPITGLRPTTDPALRCPAAQASPKT